MGPRRPAHLAALFADFAAPGLCLFPGGERGEWGGISLPLAALQAFLRSTLRVSNGVLLQLL